MKQNHIVLFSVAALLSGALYSLLPSQANAALSCQFEDQFSELAKAQENARLDYAESIKAELAIRKDILARIMDCTVEEINALKGTTNSLTNQDVPITELIHQLQEKLDEAIHYQELQKDRIQDLGIRGTQDLAKTIKDWRTTTLADYYQQVSNLSLWIANQNLFETASKRFSQIQHTVNSLKLVDNNQIGALLENAKKKLREANSYNYSAKESLSRFDPQHDALPNMKDSLGSLAGMYGTFFEISAAVEKIIPQ